MVNGIYFNVNRGGDDDSLYSSSSRFSSRRSDFPDEEGDWKKSSSSVYSRFRSWIRSPMPPGSIRGEPPKESHTSKPSGPPKIMPIETPAIPLDESIVGEEIIPYEDLSAISLDELNKLTGNFDHMYIVGESTNTSVFYATLSTGEAAAVKRIDPDSIDGSDSDIAAKLAKVSTLKHQNLLGLLGYCLDFDKRILVYPFATMGSLHDIMHGRKGPRPVLTWNQRVKIACGAAQALEYLHNEGIIHGAIKSSNILIFDDFVPKIADIHLSNTSSYASKAPWRNLPWHAARVITPIPYMPPEHWAFEEDGDCIPGRRKATYTVLE